MVIFSKNSHGSVAGGIQGVLRTTAFLVFIGLLIGILVTAASARMAYDQEDAVFVEIDDRSVLDEGNDLVLFDQKTGQNHDVFILDIQAGPEATEILVFDFENQQYRSLTLLDAS